LDKKALIVCIDGCGTEYIQESGLSFIKSLQENGSYFEVNSMIPSVTNVNSVSIITGEYPEKHGVTTNYFFDRNTGQEVYMESASFIKSPTLFELASNLGLKSALLTSKDKLLSLLNKGTSICFSAEKPLTSIKEVLGKPPSIYSTDINVWLMKALRLILKKDMVDIIYFMTTDYAMHMYEPQEKESIKHMRSIDEELQKTVRDLELKRKDVLVCITADHGMSNKNIAVNLELILRNKDIPNKMNTIIADRYNIHHSNLGGSAYIYLENAEDQPECFEVLNNIEGVEAVIPADKASILYHLDKNRIGDFLVLGKKNYVFGLNDYEVSQVQLRSHGSLHESRVPFITNISSSELRETFSENKDVASLTMKWLNR
jgi:phosphonoacetate hydrolase